MAKHHNNENLKCCRDMLAKLLLFRYKNIQTHKNVLRNILVGFHQKLSKAMSVKIITKSYLVIIFLFLVSN